MLRATNEQVLATNAKDVNFTGFCAHDHQACALTGERTPHRALLPDYSGVPLAKGKCTAAGWKELQAKLSKA